MKRIIMLSVIVMALVLGAVGIIRNGNEAVTPDISDALSVIASRSEMAKCGMIGEKITLCTDDFERALNLARIDSIKLTEVPAAAEGCLCVGNTAVCEGQIISRSNLDLLSFIPSGKNVRQSVFKFKVNDCEYAMSCNIYFLSRENSAPTLANENERTLSVSTHQQVAAYGRLRGYDPDGDALRYEIVSYAKNGCIDLDRETGYYTYTPIGEYFGSDSFTYVVSDEYGNYSAPKKVAVNVQRTLTEVVYADMKGHSAHHASLTMTEKGIMNGAQIGSNTYFMPDRSVSRIDFIAMLMNTIGEDCTENVIDTGYDDDAQIPESMKGYVKRAREMGLINGNVGENGEYSLRPNDAITRAEAAYTVSQLFDAAVPTVKPLFSDRADVPSWAQDAVYATYEMGLIESENGAINARGELNRASAAKMLCALLEMIK